MTKPIYPLLSAEQLSRMRIASATPVPGGQPQIAFVPGAPAREARWRTKRMPQPLARWKSHFVGFH